MRLGDSESLSGSTWGIPVGQRNEAGAREPLSCQEIEGNR